MVIEWLQPQHRPLFLLPPGYYQSSSSSDPLHHPSSYASAISPSELLSASRSDTQTARFTTCRKVLIRKAIVVSVVKEVFTKIDAGVSPIWENICGKLSRIGNDKFVCDLYIIKLPML